MPRRSWPRWTSTTWTSRRKVGTLNVGNRQRVEIAKALSINAKVLIMDEPTAALTESDVEQLFDIVRLLKARGVAVIYISHRLVEVFQLADRVTVLRDGHFVGSGPVAETTEGELIRMMVGRTITELFPKLPTRDRGDVLEVRDLTRRPQTNDVSFTVRGGEIVGIAGLVGSGPQRDGAGRLRHPAGRLGRHPHRRPEGRHHARPARP